MRRTLKMNIHEKILSEVIDYKYDERGNCIFKHIEWGSYGTKHSKDISYTYDSNNLLLYRITNHFINDPYEHSNICTYIYDKTGLLLRTIENDVGKMLERYTRPHIIINDYVYDKTCKLIKSICYTSYRFNISEYNEDDNIISCEREYKYNSKDQKIAENIISADRDKDFYKYKYNANNQLIREKHRSYDDGDLYTSVTDYMYDENGKLIKECYQHGTYVGHYNIIYEYNANDQLIKKIKYKDDINDPYEENIYEYNDKGHLIHKYKYEYRDI